MKRFLHLVLVWPFCVTAAEINPGFSFLSDGKREVASTNLPARVSQNGEWTVETRQLDDGLKIETHSRRFGRAVEWVNWLENVGTKDTGRIVSFKDCDVTLPFELDPVMPRAYVTTNVQTVIYAHKGSDWAEDDFSTEVCRVDNSNRSSAALFQGKSRHYGTSGGLSSKGMLPFFNVNRGEKGVIVAIGWTGQWNCDFSRDKQSGAVRIRTGLEDSDFYLKPGERIRLSSVVLLPYENGYAAAQNAFRRLMVEHYSVIGPKGPHPVCPLSFSMWGGVESKHLVDRIDFVGQKKFGFEYVWVDAGWFGRFTTPSPNEFEGAWWSEAGDWRPNELFHPDLMKDVAGAAHRNGLNFLLWLEIERAKREKPIVKEHPEYFLLDEPSPWSCGLLDLGNPKAWQWAFNTLTNVIRTCGLKCYRQDFNMEPMAHWRRADAVDGRKGLHEARHIAGLYHLFDALRAEFPDLLIDNCSGGGRRIDIEMCRRSVPLWRSDYQCPANSDPDVAQNHTRNLSLWLPHHGSGVGRLLDDTYRWRSFYSPSMISGFLYALENRPENVSEKSADWLRRSIEEYKRVRPFLDGDFWPLTPFTTDKSAWCVFEFFKPELGKGVLLAFRRAESPFAEGTFVLQGLDPAATYVLTDADTGTMVEKSGAVLMRDGLRLSIPEKRMSKLIFVSALPAAAVVRSAKSWRPIGNRKARVVHWGIVHNHSQGKWDAVLKLTNDFEMVGWVDDSASTAMRMQEPQRKRYEKYPCLTPQQVFDEVKPDLIVVECSNSELVGVSTEIAKHGIPMHMDKPLGTDLAGFREMSRICEEKGVPLQIGYMFRSNEAINKMVELAKNGVLGEIYSVEADLDHNYGYPKYPEYASSYPGGTAYLLACHAIEWAMPIFNDEMPLKTYSIVKPASGDPEWAKTHSLTIMEYPRANCVFRVCSKGTQPCRHIRIDGTDGSMELEPIEDFRTVKHTTGLNEGLAKVDQLEIKLFLKSVNAKAKSAGYHDGINRIVFQAPSDRYAGQLHELARILRGEISNPPGLYEHDRKVHKVSLDACNL